MKETGISAPVYSRSAFLATLKQESLKNGGKNGKTHKKDQEQNYHHSLID